ncbi:hypothetical protein [Geodermatophilus sp. URMC 63]
MLLLAGLAVGLFFLLRGDDGGTTVADPSTSSSPSSSRPSSPSSSSTPPPPGSTSSAPGGVPPATIPPTGLGSDRVLDARAQDCYDGDMAACDDLYFAADVDSAYESYADTCAGRQPEGTGQLCTVTFPE